MPIARAALFGDEAERRHAGLGIDLKQEDARKAMLVVPTKIGARRPPAAEQAVRLGRETLHPLCDIGGDGGGTDMLGQPFGIFGVIIIEPRFHARNSVTPSASSPSTATVGSRPLMKGSASRRSNSCHGPTASRAIGLP